MRSVPLSTIGEFKDVHNKDLVVPILTPEEYTAFACWLHNQKELHRANEINEAHDRKMYQFMAPYESLDSKGRTK